jgi:hypothetical protein
MKYFQGMQIDTLINISLHDIVQYWEMVQDGTQP